MISFQHKFIFVHVGRTGGTSFERAAGIPVTTDLRTSHLGNTDFGEKHKNLEYYNLNYPAEFDTFFKFTIVRNPFERLVSRWLWRTMVIKEDKWRNFSEFIVSLPSTSKYSEFFKLPGLSINESITRFDYIGRFEKLDEAYAFLSNRFNIPKNSILHTNKTGLQNYRDFYTPTTINLVREIYEIDLKLFNYEF